MKRLKISVDMDGVLADITSPWIEMYNRDYGDNLTYGSVKSWNLEHCVVDECGKKIYDYLATPGLFLQAKPERNAVECFKKLCEDHDVSIVTATPQNSPTGYYEKLQWIKKHFPWFDVRKNFCSAYNKDMWKADVLIDDAVHNLKDFSGLAVCFGQPWNIYEDMYTYDMFVTGWAHLIYSIDMYANDEEFRYLYGVQLREKRLCKE